MRAFSALTTIDWTDMIALNDVTFSYPAAPTRPAIKNVSFSIAPGQYVGLVGSNGSGKSTLARLLNGLHLPRSGTVTIDGLSTTVPSDLAAVRRTVQMVFQNPENQQVGTTIMEDICFGLANIATPTGEMRERALRVLDAVGLNLDPDRELDTLSGGELQRVALASSLALEPTYLILDEATSMLDPAGRDQLLSTARELNRRGTAIIHITHHLEEVEQADRLLVMSEAQLIADAPPAEIFARPQLLQSAGLRAPYRWREVNNPITSTRVGQSETSDSILDVKQISHDFTEPSKGRRARKRLADLRKSGDPQRLSDPALVDVSLSLKEGDLVALAGRSGAGKTTLISIMKGLLRPTMGDVSVGGETPSQGINSSVGYLFQHPEHQLFAPTVRRDVAYGLEVFSLKQEQVSDKVDTALQDVGLDPTIYGESSPHSLSGGQQRRVALAGVTVTNPQTLILDEPTAGLDEPSRIRLFKQLDTLRSRGIAILWVSHQLEEILEHAQRLIVLDAGTIIAQGSPEPILSDEKIRTRMGWPLLPSLDPAVTQGELLDVVR